MELEQVAWLELEAPERTSRASLDISVNLRPDVFNTQTWEDLGSNWMKSY